MADDPVIRSHVERALRRDLEEHMGRPLSRIATQTQRSVEAYLNAGVKPRWMERLMEIDRFVKGERRSLERSYRALRGECGDDRELFAARWRAFAERRGASLDYEEINHVVRQHNEWYPVERNLAMDPRTGDYVKISGRSYRRPELDAEWVLRLFPPAPPEP